MWTLEKITRRDTTWKFCQRSRKEKIYVPLSFSHPSIPDSKEPQNALLLTVAQNQSSPREPILLYSTGLINNSKEDPPSSTGLLGRPHNAVAANCPRGLSARAQIDNKLTFETLLIISLKRKGPGHGKRGGGRAWGRDGRKSGEQVRHV